MNVCCSIFKFCAELKSPKELFFEHVEGATTGAGNDEFHESSDGITNANRSRARDALKEQIEGSRVDSLFFL
jgi:hypothetical protein